jgi:hypothetical protein
VLRYHRSALPSRLEVAKPASRSLASAAVAVVGATRSTVDTWRPDRGFGLSARAFRASYAVSPRVDWSMLVVATETFYTYV